ncbi:SRPBCC family protein [Micromonospora echinospora]
MNRQPVGRLFRTDAGRDLVLTRAFRAPVEDVWASLTEPERTARWFGPWEGEPGVGRTIRVQMAYEEGEPWCDMLIQACEPPRRLAVATLDEQGSWRLEMLLAEADGVTELRFTHHLDTEEAIGEVGPGWEYYLDLLVASRDGTALPDFGDYYPAMKSFYDGLRS